MNKKLKAEYVSAAEAGDYFQALFEEDKSRAKKYFLIQRGFEFEDDEPDEPYIESDDMKFCGRFKFNKVEFNRNRFYLQLAGKEKDDFEITFDIADSDYSEVRRVIKIIFSGCDYVIVE